MIVVDKRIVHVELKLNVFCLEVGVVAEATQSKDRYVCINTGMSFALATMMVV